MAPQPPTVFLHIGTPKSGTTYLQQRFMAGADHAARQGLLWPGPRWSAHTRAVAELGRLAPGETPAPDGPWQRLVGEVLAWRGPTALVSMEWMVFWQEHQIQAAVDSLAPARVEVICTARDLLRTFVAQAQEMSKNFKPWPWSQIVDEVRNDVGGEAHRQFWRQQDLPMILQRWSRSVPVERIHLVTVPPAGSNQEVLWDRFCSVLGVDGRGFDEPRTANESLGAVSTVLRQRLNVVAAERGVSPQEYRRAIHERIGLRILAARREQEDPIALDEAMAAFLRARAAAQIAAVREIGPDLVGSWGDLEPGETPAGRRPEEVTDSELLEASLDALVTLALSVEESRPAQGRRRGRPAGG